MLFVYNIRFTENNNSCFNSCDTTAGFFVDNSDLNQTKCVACNESNCNVCANNTCS